MQEGKVFSKNKKEIILAIIVGVLITFIDLLLNGNKQYFGDAYGYDGLADYFIEHGIFNFNLPAQEHSVIESLLGIRAYGWPIIIAIFKVLSVGNKVLYKFWYSVFLTLGLCYALPELMQELFRKRIYWWQRILPLILTIIFWNGLLIFPLADIAAVITVSWGLLLLVKISENNKIRENILLSALCGLLLGISYYIRSGCKPIWFIAIIIIGCYKYKKQYIKKALLIVPLMIGVFISMIPQIQINKSYSGITSYEVPIFFTTNTANESYYHGFQWLRYETNVSGIQPEIVMIARDEVLDNILAAEDIATTDVDLKVIVKLFLKYPLEFLGMYASKFANFIDPRYGTEIYVTDLNSRQYVCMILNYLIWFMTCLGLGIAISNKEGSENKYQWNNLIIFIRKYFLYIVAFVCPALIHLAGTHVEARYFYPIYSLIYSYLAMICPWRNIINYVRRNCITVVIVGIAIFGCLNSIWNFTFERFNYSELLIEEDFSTETESLSEFLTDNQGNLVLQYDVWRMEVDDKKHLSMQGYILAENRDCDDNQMYIVFCSNDKQYMYKINLYNNPYMSDEQYSKSKYSVEKELANLEAGDYQIAFLLINKDDKNVVMTPYTVNIQ